MDECFYLQEEEKILIRGINRINENDIILAIIETHKMTLLKTIKLRGNWGKLKGVSTTKNGT